ncbi:MAG: hypothetical protein LIO90_09795 [Bacteroidales bacterium]|nr:hypothetical protein [Bacteroidales bacterium]
MINNQDAPEWLRNIISEIEETYQSSRGTDPSEQEEQRRAEAQAAKDREAALRWARQFPDDDTRCNRQHFGNKPIKDNYLDTSFDPEKAQSEAKLWASKLPDKKQPHPNSKHHGR